MVEIGWGGYQLRAGISIHVCQSSLLRLETKSIGTTVGGGEKGNV